MAKSVVRSQMGGSAPSIKGVSGTFGHNENAPFQKPQDTGNGGIPVKFQDSIVGAKTGRTRLTPTQTSFSANGDTRSGAKQFPFG